MKSIDIIGQQMFKEILLKLYTLNDDEQDIRISNVIEEIKQQLIIVMSRHN